MSKDNKVLPAMCAKPLQMKFKTLSIKEYIMEITDHFNSMPEEAKKKFIRIILESENLL